MSSINQVADYKTYLQLKESICWYNKGLEQVSASNYTEALKSFQEAIKLNKYDELSKREIEKLVSGGFVSC